MGKRIKREYWLTINDQLDSITNISAELEILNEGSFPGIRGENDEEYLKEHPPYKSAKAPCPIEIAGFSGKAGNAAAYWIPWRMQEYIQPAKVNIVLKNTIIHEPVLVDLLMGKVYQINTSMQKNDLLISEVPMTDYPLLIISESALRIGGKWNSNTVKWWLKLPLLYWYKWKEIFWPDVRPGRGA